MQEPMLHSCLPLDAVARAAASPESQGTRRLVNIEFANGKSCHLEFSGDRMLVRGQPIWEISSFFPNARAAKDHRPRLGKLPHIAVGYHLAVLSQGSYKAGTVVRISTLVMGLGGAQGI